MPNLPTLPVIVNKISPIFNKYFLSTTSGFKKLVLFVLKPLSSIFFIVINFKSEQSTYSLLLKVPPLKVEKQSINFIWLSPSKVSNNNDKYWSVFL